MKTKNQNFVGNSRTLNPFKLSMICAAVMGVLSPAAIAAEEDKEADKEFEVIEVRGIRASTEKNLSIKRMSNAMVDAITAEDIGKFPDKNVADSLQRVPGVVISRSGGEGSRVSIRGLSSDLTYTQLNGNFIASSPGEPSRSFDYSLLPSTMIETVEVYKSPEARLDEGGVGGTVLLQTRKPLDMESGSGVAQVEYTYADTTDDYEPQFTGLYSWKNEKETFGLLLGFTQQDRTNRSMGGSANGWRWTGEGSGNDVNGNPVDNTMTNAPVKDAYGNVYDNHWVPQFARANVFEENRERQGFQVTTQWRPTDNIEITGNYFGFRLGKDSTSSSIDFPEWNYTTGNATDVHLDASGTIITGVDYAVGATGEEALMDMPWIRGEYTREESTSDTFDLNLKYEGDDFTVSITGGHTEAEGGPTEKYETAYYSSNNRSGESTPENAAQYSGWNIVDNKMTFYIDPMMIENLHAGIGGGADPGSSNSSFVKSTLEEDYLQLDFDKYIDFSIFTEIHAGVKYRKATLHRETRNTYYLDPDANIEELEARPGGITLNDSYQWNGGMPDASLVIHKESLGNFPGGFETNLFPAMNWGAYAGYLNDNYQRYTRIEPNFVYDIEEEITAAYFQADFEEEKYRGNIGLRVVETKTTGASSDIFVYHVDYYDDAGEEIPHDDRTKDIYSIVTQESSNTQYLPSFNIAYDLTDDIIIRGALARVMSRPDYSDLGAQERLTWVSPERAGERDEYNEEEGWSGSGGNKNLEPFISNQADLSIEYYYGEGSAVGLALFSKEVDNFVVPIVMDVYREVPELTYELNGKTVTTGGTSELIEDYSTTGNGTNATSRGVEVFVQHSFESGFGVYGNYTYNDTNKADVSVDGEDIGESALIGSADYQFNFSAYYENDVYSIRASYNLRGEAVQGVSNGMNVYSDAYDQVDLNASYEIIENLVFNASVINLLENESFTYIGDDTTERFQSSRYTGRRFYAGVTYNF